MRTTLDIDDDILAAAKDLARAEGRTMGQVVSDLARRALTSPVTGNGVTDNGQVAFDAGAWPTLPNRGGAIVTTDLVNRIQDELDGEAGEALDHTDAKDRQKRHKNPGRGR